jgi:ribosomal protein L11
MLSSKVKDIGSSPVPPATFFSNFQYMKTNLNFDFDKLHLKEVIVLVPKYHTNMVSFLTPILGLYGINVKEFITDFESKTRFINFDIIIPVRVKITKIKTFEIFVKTPYVTSILSNLEGFSLTKPNLNALILYKISLIKSIFSASRLTGFHKMIYISLRKYIARILKTSSLASIIRPTLSSVRFEDFKYITTLKHNFLSLVFLKGLICQKYGFFAVFSNQNGNRLNYLVNQLSLYNVSVAKVNSKLLTLLSDIPFSSNSFYIASNQFNYVANLLKETLRVNQSGSFFIPYYRLNCNLSTSNFLKTFLLSFNKLKGVFTLVKVLHVIFLKFIKSAKFLHLALIRLLTYKNANVSSNII